MRYLDKIFYINLDCEIVSIIINRIYSAMNSTEVPFSTPKIKDQSDKFPIKKRIILLQKSLISIKKTILCDQTKCLIFKNYFHFKILASSQT